MQKKTALINFKIAFISLLATTRGTVDILQHKARYIDYHAARIRRDDRKAPEHSARKCLDHSLAFLGIGTKRLILSA